MKMLTKQQILLLHSQMILQFGGSDGIRDEAMLDSAINQPFTLTYLTKKNKCSFGWRRFMAVPSGTAFFMPILGKEQTSQMRARQKPVTWYFLPKRPLIPASTSPM